jgi:hypothetical protein
MPYPEFKDLPFNERPDLSPYIIHLTKNTQKGDGYSGFDNLVSILREGEIWASSRNKGFIKGPHKATCFMDVPFSALKYVLNPRDADPNNPRYEPYGIVVSKTFAYNHGCRPVLYLSDQEIVELQIPDKHLWRVVRFEVKNKRWISWLHEREWRCKGNFRIPSTPYAVLVKTAKDAVKLNKMLRQADSNFAVRPQSIIPLEVICQGFLK